jgi:hypothetical protein
VILFFSYFLVMWYYFAGKDAGQFTCYVDSKNVSFDTNTIHQQNGSDCGPYSLGKLAELVWGERFEPKDDLRLVFFIEQKTSMIFCDQIGNSRQFISNNN